MSMKDIIRKIENDPHNRQFTQLGIKPLFTMSPEAKILIIGQAPGLKAQESKQLFHDPSGDILREWLGINRELFYDSNLIAILPMDFYYPGKTKSGDKPPRSFFAKQWHPYLIEQMPNIEITLLVGRYAQAHYISDFTNLTNTVKHYQDYLPQYFPLVHPSPRNFRWHAKNPWFKQEVIPHLQKLIYTIVT